MWHIDALQLALALALDLLLGDPRRGPHVTRLAGALSLQCEGPIRRLVSSQRLAGAAHWVVIGGLAATVCGLVLWLLERTVPRVGWVFEIAVMYQTIGATDLTRHARAVAQPLACGQIEAARANLSRLVGRDTDSLGESEVARATIESVAEGSHDAFLGPLFWGLVAGVPAAVLYRVANTLDSMVGHKDERYQEFGWVSARVDDLLSWIPARLSAFGLWIRSRRPTWRRLACEARRHASPNAGWSEAAMAHLLGVRLGGTNYYKGRPLAVPVFCGEGPCPSVNDIRRSLRAFRLTAGVLGTLSIGIAIGREYL